MAELYQTNDGRTFNNQGDAQRHANEMAAGSAALQKANAIRIDNGNSLIAQGARFEEQGQYEEAINCYISAISRCRSHEAPVTFGEARMGQSYYKMGDYRNAVSYFESALRRNKEYDYLNAQSVAAVKQMLAEAKRKEFEVYLEEAEQGDATAQSNLGFCYKEGYGVPQDYAKALYWYKKAADQGYTGGMFALGRCYKEGIGVPQDYAKAAEWFQKAADLGDEYAKQNLRNMGIQYVSARQAELDAKAEAAKSSSQGKALAEADKKFEKDFEKAEELFFNKGKKEKAVDIYEKLAKKDYHRAQERLGYCYYEGFGGLQKDYAKAVELFRKAAEQGFDEGQYKLGKCYYKGSGVPKDYAIAGEWYRKAAEQGHKEATAMYKDMKNTGKI